MKNMLSIKPILLYAIVLTISFLRVNAQNDSLTNKKFTEIMKRLDKIEEEKKVSFGTISYIIDDTTTYNVYKGEQVIRRVPIDSIYVFTHDGYIVDLTFYSKRDRFTNNDAPIGLTKNRFSKEDNICNVANGQEFIILKEVLILEGRNLVPEDDEFTLKRGKNARPLTRDVGINSIFDIRVYTDALGLFGGVANSLVQTDATYRHILHSKNLPNSGVFIFHYFNIKFNVNKFDSKDKYADSVNFSRLKVLQKSFINAEISLNIIDAWLFEKKSSNFIYFDVGSGINSTYFSKKKDSTIINTMNLFGEFGLRLTKSNNIGANISGRFLYQYSPQTPYPNDSNPAGLFKASAEIFFNPFGSPASRLFARANFITSIIDSDKKNNYLQVQLGFSVQLTKLIKK